MKRAFLLALGCTILMASCRQDSVEYDLTDRGVEINWQSQKIFAEFYGTGVVRIYRSTLDSIPPKKSLVVISEQQYKPQVQNRNDRLSLRTPQLEVRFDKSSGNFSFYDANGRPIVAENTHGFEQYTDPNEKALSFRQSFELEDHEGVYGLGQFQDGHFNLRGHERLLVQSNFEAINPFLVSSKGYGILWDNYSQTKFKDDESGMSFWSEIGDGIDYYLVAGNTMDEAISGYRDLTGKAPMLPKWAYGYWQSKERYKTQQEVLDIVKGYRDRKLPLDLIVQDWRYWGDDFDLWSSTVMNSKRYPNPKMMINKLHQDYNTRFMIVFWPMLGKATDVGQEMIQSGYVYDYDAGPRVLYDAFNPKARDLYWKHLNNNLFSIGVDAWWMDGSEPELWEVLDQEHIIKETKKAGNIYPGSAARYLNPFTLLNTQGVYENQRATSEDKRVCILTRSAFSGQQRYGAVTWSGDIVGSYEVLDRQISTGLNFSMAGIPYWTQDIGGWLVNVVGGLYKNGCKDPAYAELYTRWFQFGAFNPIFRSHGSNTPREIWQFGGPETKFYQSMAKFSKLRYRLMPYLYSLAHQIHTNDYTPMRSLMMDYSDDPAVDDLDDQFMFGSAFLVDPVTQWMYHPEVASVLGTHFVSPEGEEGHVKATYFKGREFQEKVTEKKVSRIKFRHSEEPFEGMPIDSFSIRYEGKIRTETTGEYEFVTSSDDGVRLWIDGQLIIDDWNSHAEILNTAKIKLEGDRLYDFKLEYYDDIYAAVLDFGWRIPQPKALDKSRLEVSTYLPTGTQWYQFWSNERHNGGQHVSMDCPLDLMPLYLPAGAIVPFGPDIQYAEEKYDDPIEIRIYPGADGQFVLYEDEGDSYDYEDGAYSTIRFSWDDASQKLTVGKRQGLFPGMEERRVFSIVLATTSNGLGMAVSTPNRTVDYRGDQMIIDLGL
ncbi:MAG: DUF5110 domain-containing protein [Cyclobacteriaceae bacterium]|nr:DUF5110 domain-containing protein [Cyclobacteriaceae bacterium HetDA_MAG_MS6]